jgi:hypothetical protein
LAQAGAKAHAPCRLVVLVLDDTPGTLWEFVEATRVVSPERLLLVAPSSEEKYERFRAAATARLRDRAENILRQTGERWDPPTLPLDPPIRTEQLRSGLRDAMPFGGTISFSADWTPHFTRLKVTPPMLGMGAAGPTLWRAVRPAVKRALAAEEVFPKRHDPELLKKRKEILSAWRTITAVLVSTAVVPLFMFGYWVWVLDWDITRVSPQWWLMVPPVVVNYLLARRRHVIRRASALPAPSTRVAST